MGLIRNTARPSSALDPRGAPQPWGWPSPTAPHDYCHPGPIMAGARGGTEKVRQVKAQAQPNGQRCPHSFASRRASVSGLRLVQPCYIFSKPCFLAFFLSCLPLLLFSFVYCIWPVVIISSASVFFDPKTQENHPLQRTDRQPFSLPLGQYSRRASAERLTSDTRQKSDNCCCLEPAHWPPLAYLFLDCRTPCRIWHHGRSGGDSILDACRAHCCAQQAEELPIPALFCRKATSTSASPKPPSPADWRWLAAASRQA